MLQRSASVDTTVWVGRFPPPEAADRRIRARLRDLDTRSVSRTLALAALLSLNRATLVPAVLGPVVARLPPHERLGFAGYLDPTAIYTAAAMAILFTAMALLACRRPLLAASVATGCFLAASVPLILANPVLIGGGHLGRVVMLAILLRALATAGVYHAR